jgi:hypothetical protein
MNSLCELSPCRFVALTTYRRSEAEVTWSHRCR